MNNQAPFDLECHVSCNLPCSGNTAPRMLKPVRLAVVCITIAVVKLPNLALAILNSSISLTK